MLLEDESCSTEVISDTAGASNNAATRGRSDFAEEECAETPCVKVGESLRSLSSSGDILSTTGLEYWSELLDITDDSPWSLERGCA